MSDVTVIGRGTRVRGRVFLGGGRGGGADLEIHGHLEGEAVLDGEITVEVSGLVAANLSGRRIVVRGAVKGDLTAEESIVLEEGARVVGDVRAPRVAVASGAFLRGEVAAGDVDAPRSRTTAQATARAPQQRAAAPAPQAASRMSAPVARPVAAPPPPAAKPVVSVPNRIAPAPARPTDERAAAARPSNVAIDRAAIIDLDNAPTIARVGGPPPPVVPALKKGAKGSLNKKRA